MSTRLFQRDLILPQTRRRSARRQREQLSQTTAHVSRHAAKEGQFEQGATRVRVMDAKASGDHGTYRVQMDFQNEATHSDAGMHGCTLQATLISRNPS